MTVTGTVVSATSVRVSQTTPRFAKAGSAIGMAATSEANAPAAKIVLAIILSR